MARHRVDGSHRVATVVYMSGDTSMAMAVGVGGIDDPLFGSEPPRVLLLDRGLYFTNRFIPFRGEATEVVSVEWDREGQELLIATNGGGVSVYDVDSNHVNHELRAGELGVVTRSPAKDATCEIQDRDVVVWTADTRQVIDEVSTSTSSAAWSRDGGALAVRDGTAEVMIWDEVDLKQYNPSSTALLEFPKSTMLSMAWGPAMQLAVAADGYVTVLDWRTNEIYKIFSNLLERCGALAWGPVIAVGHGRGMSLIVGRDLVPLTCPVEWANCVGFVTALSWSRCGRYLAGGHTSGGIALWDDPVRDPGQMPIHRMMNGAVSTVAIQPVPPTPCYPPAFSPVGIL